MDSPVTEQVDIFLATDVESGYCFAHTLSFVGKMPMVGVILGTKVPVVLNMDYISPEDRMVEIAIAKLKCRKRSTE